MYSVRIRPINPTKKSKELNLDFFGPLDEDTIRNWQKIVKNDMQNIYELHDQYKSIYLGGGQAR